MQARRSACTSVDTESALIASLSASSSGGADRLHPLRHGLRPTGRTRGPIDHAHQILESDGVIIAACGVGNLERPAPVILELLRERHLEGLERLLDRRNRL